MRTISTLQASGSLTSILVCTPTTAGMSAAPSLPVPPQAGRIISARGNGCSLDSQRTAVSNSTHASGVTEKGSSDGFLKPAGKLESSGERTEDAQAQKLEGRVLPDGRVLLTEREAYSKLGFSFPTRKKWWILSVIFAVQVSMSLNAALYANAVPLLSEHFSISQQVRWLPLRSDACHCDLIVFLVL